jgi:hypothetical protein
MFIATTTTSPTTIAPCDPTDEVVIEACEVLIDDDAPFYVSVFIVYLTNVYVL